MEKRDNVSLDGIPWPIERPGSELDMGTPSALSLTTPDSKLDMGTPSDPPPDYALLRAGYGDPLGPYP